MPHKNNENNLEPYKIRTSEEARRRGRNGGIKSGAARREQSQRNKTMRETVKQVFGLNMEVKPDLKQQLERMGYPVDEGISCLFLAIFKQMNKALKGDLDALEFLRDTAGENPRYAPPEQEQRADDGFIECLNGIAAEVTQDAGDEPEDIDPIDADSDPAD